MTTLSPMTSPVSLILSDCLVALAGYPDDYFDEPTQSDPHPMRGGYTENAKEER